MKTPSFIRIVAIAFISIAVFAFNNAPNRFKVNIKESKVHWKAEKVTGSHEGLVNLTEGGLEIEDGKLVGGSFVVDMTTIITTDLEGEYADKLVTHLKSDDFFGVENHPTAKLTIKKAVWQGKNNFKVVGDLTIKGTTHEVTFPATVTEKGNKVTAEAKITVDRTKYNVRYGSGSFFDNLGDNTIYDNFDLNVTLVASK